MVKLAPMNKGDFDQFLDRSICEYAMEKTQSGNWSAQEAMQLAKESFAQLLPAGLATPHHYIYSIVIGDDPERKVGDIWMAVQQAGGKASGFIYDLYVCEEYRRMGIASQAMRALEEKARELGLEQLLLHVFGHNLGAQALYTKLGYRITNINMAKSLD